MTPEEIARIAEGLTKAQSAAIIEGICSKGIAASLRRKGFLAWTHCAADGLSLLMLISNIGVPVRAHLLEQGPKP